MGVFLAVMVYLVVGQVTAYSKYSEILIRTTIKRDNDTIFNNHFMIIKYTCINELSLLSIFLITNDVFESL